MSNGIYCIDAKYGRDNLAAVYLIVEGGKAALVETAHARSLPNVLAKLAELNLDPSDVEYILLTHIHLDHAGGAGVYMDRFKNARLVVHPKGVRHMIDPSKLEAGVVAVYGAEFVANMYGKLLPISEDRILVGTDGYKVNLNGRMLECRDTPGHANHHNIIIDHSAKAVFTGDVFGVAYPEFITADGRQLYFPTTSPVNFNPEKMFQSIDLIESLQPSVVYLTHFNGHSDIKEIVQQLKTTLARYLQIAEANKTCSNRVNVLEKAFCDDFLSVMQKENCQLSLSSAKELIKIDMNLNAQGVDFWLSSQQ